MSAAPEPSQALTRALLETERHVADAGWDQNPRLFALVRTQAVLARESGLQEQLSAATLAAAAQDSGHLMAIEQEGLPPTAHLESLLGGLAWGPHVDGVAIVVERIIVPPEAERDLPSDPQAALDTLATHPQRADVRLVVAVLRDGQQQCGVRQRPRPQPDAELNGAAPLPSQVSVGPQLVPGLAAALHSTLAES